MTSKQPATPHSTVSGETTWQQIQRKPTAMQPATASGLVSVNTTASSEATTSIQPAATHSVYDMEMAASSKKTSACPADNLELAELVKVAVAEAIKGAIPMLVEDVSQLTNRTQALVDAQVMEFRGEMVAMQADIFKCMNYMEKDESRVVKVDRRFLSMKKLAEMEDRLCRDNLRVHGVPENTVTLNVLAFLSILCN